jgi:hypothetical protein
MWIFCINLFKNIHKADWVLVFIPKTYRTGEWVKYYLGGCRAGSGCAHRSPSPTGQGSKSNNKNLQYKSIKCYDRYKMSINN